MDRSFPVMPSFISDGKWARWEISLCVMLVKCDRHSHCYSIDIH